MKNNIFIGFLLLSMSVFAQEHDHHKNHLGVGLGGVHIFSKNENVSGIHLHYLHKLQEHSPFSLGLGIESIRGGHSHNTITGLLNFSVLEHFSINVGPGLTFEKEDGKQHTKLSGHLEFLYEFELGEFHLGPMAGFGFDPDESHASIGIHLGFGF